MAQQNASALALRTGEDAGGHKQNRQIQAYSRQTSRGRALARKGSLPHARKPQQPVEAQAKRESGEAVVSWEMRCPDLGHHNWLRFAGSPEPWRAVREWADRLDHDEARPIGWGREVEIEARRYGRVSKWKVTGEIRYRYHVKATTA